jgi:hypothetical protein
MRRTFVGKRRCEESLDTKRSMRDATMGRGVKKYEMVLCRKGSMKEKGA